MYAVMTVHSPLFFRVFSIDERAVRMAKELDASAKRKNVCFFALKNREAVDSLRESLRFRLPLRNSLFQTANQKNWN